MKNNVLQPEDIPQVAMDAMNDVHRNELGIVNELNKALLENDTAHIRQLCDQWLEHTLIHFDRENLMMEKYQFPAFSCHHGEHVDAIRQLESIIKQWKTSRDNNVLSVYVNDIWAKWYVNHIATMDVVTSAFIKQCMENEVKS